MPRHSPTTDPELKAHREWLGYLQPVGLVVAPAAMLDAGWVVTRSGSELIERQERYREALELLKPQAESDESENDNNGLKGFRSLAELLTDHLGWNPEQLDTSPEAITAHTKELPELGETLAATSVVPSAAGEGAQLLVMELPLAAAFDQKTTDGEHLWRASAQERLERLLRETGVEAGLLFNGRQLRLVVAPKGESSGHLTFTLAELAEVSGRLMFSGLDLLLGQSHVFLDPDGTRLADVLKKSRSFQAVVSNALADQVLAALWDLLRGFQQADELAQRQDDVLLGDLPDRDPQQLYGGLITVLMRLVFLLYAEDEALMPADAVYEQNYKLSAFFEQLQRDDAEYPDTMEQRYGAWAGLMSLCRLVFDGGGPSENYLPARHGQLFDPNAYPWLETPWISDGVVLAVLRNLLIVNGEKISYRALDVEQIGSVYEGIMGYAVRRIPGRCIGLKSKPQGAKKQLTTAVDLDALLELPGGKRKAWLETEAGTTLPNKSINALKAAGTEAELLQTLAPRIDHNVFDGPQAAGSLVFQPTEERRRSGSHYTPRSLTRPIVEEALRPWLEDCGGKPTVVQILALKICDPAMGSGAFLVECCRYLAELLEQAWSREGIPEALNPNGSAHGEEPLLYARRMIAQSCLYGVDKNPFAVNLARLSLWLMSLSRNTPFTFLDHALKQGDSLVGCNKELADELRSEMSSIQGRLNLIHPEGIKERLAIERSAFNIDSRNDKDDELKRASLIHQERESFRPKAVASAIVAVKLAKHVPDISSESIEDLITSAQRIDPENEPTESAATLARILAAIGSLTPFHWDLEFPEVFSEKDQGFDAILGNPPYLGGSKISRLIGKEFFAWIKNVHGGHGKSDLSAFFLRACSKLIKQKGTISFITTNSIYKAENRETSITWLLENGWIIYSARRRYRWPGDAAVVCSIISLVNACGKKSKIKPILDGIERERISAYLLPFGPDLTPKTICKDLALAASGINPNGKGFILTPEQAIKLGGINNLIKPFIGSDEINSYPEPETARFAIDCRGLGLEQVQAHNAIYDHLCQTVKIQRQSSSDSKLKEKWWLFSRPANLLYDAISRFKCTRLIVGGRHSAHSTYTIVSSSAVISDAATAFPCEDSMTYALFALLQSDLHSYWSEIMGSSIGESPRYIPDKCFDTFPFPESWKSRPGDKCSILSLNHLGKILWETRAEACRELHVGLTTFYNRLNSPDETSTLFNEARRMTSEIEINVLYSYGLSDPAIDQGFSVEIEELENLAKKSDQDATFYKWLEINGSYSKDDEIFAKTPDEAIELSSELVALLGGDKQSIPWSFGLSPETRNLAFSKLLELNEKLSSKHNNNNGSSRKRVPAAKSLAQDTDPIQIGFQLG